MASPSTPGSPPPRAEGLILATSEAVANAIVHGQPPIVLRIWAQPDRMTVTVTDTGAGPTDPFVGLLPAGPRPDRTTAGWAYGSATSWWTSPTAATPAATPSA